MGNRQLANNPYYKSIIAFFEEQDELVFLYLQEHFISRFKDKNEKIDCDRFIYTYVMVFKNAFPGFWTRVAKELSYNDIYESGIDELCLALEAYYHTKDIDEAIAPMISMLSHHPDMYLAEELLAFSYYTEKLWKNAIAYYERLIKRSSPITIDSMEGIYFNLAWAYGKTSNHIKEAERYEETLRLNPKYLYAKNNLAYSYFQQGQLMKALELFDECIKDNRDTPYCYNNKIRALLALGENKKALEFAQENRGRNKVSKDMLTRTERACMRTESNATIVVDDDIDTAENQRVTKSYLPLHQFSSERILEDELVSRIDKEMPVFGVDLRVYEVEGDYYGRQYPIDGGRIDILAIDDNDNLYAIELKKDSGYDDAYKQTRRYVDWLKKHKAKNGTNVFGIICLNNPSDCIKTQIKTDSEIRLFEYGISYNEVL